MDESERYDQGLKLRREVLGDAHVDAALASRTVLNAEFQEFLTRYARPNTRPSSFRETLRAFGYRDVDGNLEPTGRGISRFSE